MAYQTSLARDMKGEDIPSFAQILKDNPAYFDEPLSTRRAADFIGVTDQYLRFRRSQKGKVERGPGPKYHIIKGEGKTRGLIRYTRRDLLKFFEAQEVAA